MITNQFGKLLLIHPEAKMAVSGLPSWLALGDQFCVCKTNRGEHVVFIK